MTRSPARPRSMSSTVAIATHTQTHTHKHTHIHNHTHTGFFMNMRNDYVKPGAKIHYYVVEWDSKVRSTIFCAVLIVPVCVGKIP